MSRAEIFRAALSEPDAAGTLRSLVQRFLNVGIAVDELQEDLTVLRRSVQGTDPLEDIVLDTQDVLEGWCAPDAGLIPKVTEPPVFNRRRHSARAAPTERTGTIGETEAVAAFQRIGWGPARNEWHDLGIDLFVQVRDARRFDRGLVVTAQVKGGPSAFKEPATNKEGVAGWIYRDEAVRFDDWVTHGLPHLLVLADIEERICYWAHVTREEVEETGVECKIHVRADHKIDADGIDDLFQVASSQKAHGRLEGTAWNAGPKLVPPARAWRYALIVPRMVAPHPNRTRGETIGPEQAAALVTRARYYDWDEIAKANEAVPSRTRAVVADDWGWQFAGALACAVIDGQPELLYAMPETATENRTRAAAAVAAGAYAIENNEPAVALEILEKSLAGDHLEPEDEAWVHLQMARVLADGGDVPEARRLAVAALNSLTASADDVSASAISAGAAWLLFSTADLLSGDLESMVTASDNAASWWRSLEVSSALTNFFTRTFELWGGDNSLRFENVNETSRGLFAATTEANFAGDPGAAHSTASLLGRYLVMASATRPDSVQVSDALDLLRRAGDHKAVDLVARRLSMTGPFEPLRSLAESFTEDLWTRSATKSNLIIWRHAHDFLNEEGVYLAASFCHAGLTDPDHVLRHLQLTFIFQTDLLATLRSLLHRPMAAIHDMAATLLLDLAHESTSNSLMSHDLQRLANAIDWDLVEPSLRASVASLAHSGPKELGRELVRAMRKHEPAALEALAAEGDNSAVALLVSSDALPSQLAAAAVERVARVVRTTVESARGGAHSFGSDVDYGGLLAQLNLTFPSDADWSTLFSLLTSEAVLSDDKRLALRVLAVRSDAIPDDILKQLRDSFGTFAAASARTTPWEGVHVLDHLRLGLKLGVVNDAEMERVLVHLVASDDARERQAATALVGERGIAGAPLVLATLARDPDLEVSKAAAWAAGRRLRQEPTSDTFNQLVMGALASPGIARVLMCLDGLSGSSETPIPERILHTIGHLADTHLSYRVRARCKEVLSIGELADDVDDDNEAGGESSQ